MSLPKVSIITPVLNAENTIHAAIQSVENQEYSNIEYLIIDGISTDGTLEIIKSFELKYLKLFSEKDKGIYDAMNKALDLVTGEWVYFLGSDDTLEPGILNKIFSNNETKDYDIIYGNVRFKKNGRIYNGEYDFSKLFEENICHQAIFARKSVFSMTGKFNLKYSINADYDFNVKWLGNSEIKSVYVPYIIAVYNELGVSSAECDEAILDDKFFLFRRHFRKPLDKVMLYNELGRLGLDKLAKRDYKNGLRYILQSLTFSDRKKYLLTNTAYWVFRHLGLK
jgi:glycosyltransferase involved in cell wall biosynthesis